MVLGLVELIIFFNHRVIVNTILLQQTSYFCITNQSNEWNNYIYFHSVAAVPANKYLNTVSVGECIIVYSSEEQFMITIFFSKVVMSEKLEEIIFYVSE